MTFINDNGDQLNFDGAFAISKRSISLFDGKIKGDTSINFSVDNNSYNRKVLGYYGPQMLNQIAATKQAFNRVRNGNIIDRGYIVIQDDYNDVLDCYYVTGNSNWIQKLNLNITDLDYTGVNSLRNYTIQMNDTTVKDSVGKTFGVVFPIADWWENYERGKSVYNSISIPYGGAMTDSNQNNSDSPIFDFYPCMYVSSIFDEITAQTGIKISGNLINDGLFKTLVVPPVNGLITKSKLFTPIVLTGTVQAIGSGFNKYDNLSQVNFSSSLFSSARFIIDRDCRVKSTVQIIFVSTFTSFEIVKNGAAISTHSTNESTAIDYVDLRKGDYLEIFVSGIVNITINWTLEQKDNIGYNSYTDPSDFLPKIKCIDFIKTFINLFGCTSYFDSISNTLTLTIIDKILLTDAQDWSSYYRSHRSEYTVNTSTNNYINVKSNSDLKIKAYNNVNTTSYGCGNIQTNSNISTSREVVNLPFSSCSFDKETDNSYKTRIPLVQLENRDFIPFNAITDSGSGVSIFTSSITANFVKGEIVRVLNSAGTDYGLFPIVLDGINAAILFPFYATDTGYIIKQSASYNDVGFTLLSNVSVNCWDLYPGYLSFYDYIESSPTSVPSYDYAIYSKYRTGLPIDRFKFNLAIDNPNIIGFNDPDIKEQYFNSIENFFENPPIRMKMLLPESIYQSFNFDKWVYVKSKKLTGYFLVDDISNYADGNTEVEINFYML